MDIQMRTDETLHFLVTNRKEAARDAHDHSTEQVALDARALGSRPSADRRGRRDVAGGRSALAHQPVDHLLRILRAISLVYWDPKSRIRALLFILHFNIKIGIRQQKRLIPVMDF